MKNTIKKIGLGLVSLTLIVGLSGCGSEHTEEQVIAKVLKKNRIAEDSLSINSFSYEELGKNEAFQTVDYQYTIEGTFTKEHCDGMKSNTRGFTCLGKEYPVGSPFKQSKKVSISYYK